MATMDANHRKYSLGSEGVVHIDDSECKRALPAMKLPPLHAAPSCGASHCIAVTRTFQAVSWATSAAGSRFGQLGWGDAKTRPYDVGQVVMSEAAGCLASVAAGDAHTALVTESGGLWLCGSDRWTQLGQEQFWSKGHVWQRKPQPCAALRQRGVQVVAAACGADHTLGLDTLGRVWAFGRGEHGQLFEASRPFTSPPEVSTALRGAKSLFASGNCSCARFGDSDEWTCIGSCASVRTAMSSVVAR